MTAGPTVVADVDVNAIDAMTCVVIAIVVVDFGIAEAHEASAV